MDDLIKLIASQNPTFDWFAQKLIWLVESHAVKKDMVLQQSDEFLREPIKS